MHIIPQYVMKLILDWHLTYCRFCLCQNKWWKLFPATYSARQAVFRTTSFIEIESTFMFKINLCTLNDLAFVLLERYNIFFYVYYLHCTLICILDNNCDVGVPGQVSPVNKRRVFSGWVTLDIRVWSWPETFFNKRWLTLGGEGGESYSNRLQQNRFTIYR